MPLMGYTNWREFKDSLDRAKASAQVQNMDVTSLFEVNLEKSGGRPRQDFRLTRFAAYLVAMNGDPHPARH